MVQNGSKWFNLGSISILTPIMSYLLSYISDLYDYLCKIKYTKSILFLKTQSPFSEFGKRRLVLFFFSKSRPYKIFSHNFCVEVQK